MIARQREGYFSSSDGRNYMTEAGQLAATLQVGTPEAAYKAFVLTETARHQKQIPCEQTPQNIFALDRLLALFPDAKALIMIRDPREVLLSQKNKWKRRQLTEDTFPLRESIRARLNYHPVTMSRIWNSVSREARKWEHDRRVMIVKFEQLLTEPVSTIENICIHCGLPFEPNMLNIPVVGSSNVSDRQDSRKGIDVSRSGKWKKGLTPEEIQICQEITAPEMKHWGYLPEAVNASPIGIFLMRLTMPLKLALSVPFNLKRLKDPSKLLKRVLNR